MKEGSIGVLLLLLAVILSASCRINKDSDIPDDLEGSVSVSEQIKENGAEEVNNVKREFCKVISVQEDDFTLENTVHELYCIDNSFLKNFKTGDKVLLLYHDRTLSDDGVYSADVYAVYPDDDVFLQPAN